MTATVHVGVRMGGGKQTLSEDLLAGADAAANFIGLKPKAVYRMTASGKLPVIRMGRNLFYRKSDLERAFSIPQTELNAIGSASEVPPQILTKAEVTASAPQTSADRIVEMAAQVTALQRQNAALLRTLQSIGKAAKLGVALSEPDDAALWRRIERRVTDAIAQVGDLTV